MKANSADNPSGKQTAWGPLRQHLFRSLWIAAVVSNVGTWVQDVGEAWLMTSMTKSPILISGRHVETFIVETWVEHLRQHERVTISDRSVQERVNAFHIGAERLAVSHFIYVSSTTRPARPARRTQADMEIKDRLEP